MERCIFRIIYVAATVYLMIAVADPAPGIFFSGDGEVGDTEKCKC